MDEVWQSRRHFIEFEEELDQEVAEQKKKQQRFIDFDGNEITGRNYVGTIQFEGERINIFPKVFRKKSEQSTEEINNYLQHVLEWLSYCYKIRFPFSEVDVSEQRFDDYLEAFIYIFSHYTDKVLSQQHFQTYEEVTEEMSFIKGSLAVQEYITRSLIKGRDHRMQCTYEPFQYNNLFNQIVKHTARLLNSVSNHSVNKSKLQSIIFLLEDVEDRVCTADDCRKVKLNRLFEELEIILTMSKMFLGNQTISNTDFGRSNFCFLLPMEYVFENFLFGFLEEKFAGRFKELTYQKNNLSLASVSVNGEPPANIFKMQHDIFMQFRNLKKSILDAKYKLINLNEPSDLKYGVLQADIYQVLSYAFKRGVSDVALVYPDSIETISETEKDSIVFSIKGENGTVVNVHLFQVPVICKNNFDKLELENVLITQLQKLLTVLEN